MFLMANLCAHLTLMAQETEFFRGNLQAPNGSAECNPCVESVLQSINTLRNHGTTLGFNWGDNYPEVKGAGTKSHWQGVQRMPMMGLEFPFIVVCSSHRDQIFRPNGQTQTVSGPAHFAVVEMASRRNNVGRRLRSNRLAVGVVTRFVPPDALDRIVKAHAITPDFDHPGGMQAIGKYLLVGTDGNIEHNRDVAEISLWDMADPSSPRAVWTEPNWELPFRNANSVGITRLEDGRYLIVRALTDAKELEFYLLSDSLEDNPAAYHNGVVYDRWHYQELESELFNPDSTLDLNWADLGSIFGDVGYQSTNLVTECVTGTLYLVCSHGRRPQGFGGDDFVDAYRLDVPVDPPDPDLPGHGVVITKVAKRHMFPSGNAQSRQGDLQAAGGSYVSPDNKLYYYATEHGQSGDGGFVKMIEFAPAEAMSEVRFIEDAWVELYDRKDFDGRSIILDYADRHLRDYASFSNIEEFDNLASSVLYAIPVGYKIRIFAGQGGEGGYLDLMGSGSVNRIADLGTVVLSTGESANNRFSSAEWISSVTAAEHEAEVGQLLPSSFELYQNYPNPFNPETIINYQVNMDALIRIAVYDIKGQLIKILVEQQQGPGFYSLTWDGTDEFGSKVASGTYLYRLEVQEFVQTKKLTLLR